MNIFTFFKFGLLSTLIGLFFLGCQTPTEIIESDLGLEQRVFSKIEHGKDVELKRAVIVDVRSRFDHEMSRPPRSFFAFWKDWDLSGYSGARLETKKAELQRLLSLKGIDPLVQVVILGNGLKGKGEEFLVASTLLSLGVERISFMTAKQAKEALTALNIPKVKNLTYWQKPLKYKFNCKVKGSTTSASLMKKADIVISSSGKSKSLRAQDVFSKSLKVKRQSYPKGMKLRIYSPETQWAYGLALYFKNQGRQPCVL